MLNASEWNSLCVTTDLENLATIRSHIRHVCESAEIAGLTDEDRRQGIAALELAVTELISNVIRHGHEGVPGAELTIRLAVVDDEFEFELLHDGHSFDGNAAEIADITEPQEGGMGLFLIAQSVDRIEYTTTADGANRIYLTRSFSSTEGI